MSKKLNLTNEHELTFALPFNELGPRHTSLQQGISWTNELHGIPDSWKATQGKGVKIAVLDTGLAPNHPALKCNVLEVADFSNTASNAGDGHGHGTHIAGILAAKEMKPPGPAGIAPMAKLLIGKVLDDNGRGNANAIAEGIYWAVDCGANLIILNCGSEYEFVVIKKAIKYATKAKTFILSSIGDSGTNWNTFHFPASENEVITVGNEFNYYNTPPIHALNVPALFVPSREVVSTFPPKGYASMSGAATSTAIATGIAALALSKHYQFGGTTPIRSSEDLLNHLERVDFSSRLGASSTLVNPETFVNTRAVA
ncbi:MAG: hypothetical protein DHS20C18_26710 [Saprospiraceae bacterium]|nr:MAG: hypothetical protein DHS20C18_26710 [Saprospiraceae bacterium]